MALHLNNISFKYTDDIGYIFDELDLIVPSGKTIAIMGASGIGKTTLSKLMVGLLPVNKGTILLDEEVVQKPSKNATITFQENPCFPWLTVLENVTFGIEEQPNAKKIAIKLLDKMGLKDTYHLYPNMLSGGMRQRVNIARALVIQPKYLILDEPFSALDIGTKHLLFDVLREEQVEHAASYVVILHSIEDAYDLADIIYVLGGKPTKVVLTIDRPKEIKFEAFKKRLLYIISKRSTKKTDELS